MTYDGAATAIMLGLLIITLIFINRSALRDANEQHEEFQEKILTVDEARMETAELRKREPKPDIPIIPKRLAGTYKITHYTPALDEGSGTGLTASGKKVEECVGWSCAANREDFPLGTLLYVDGYGYLTVEDTGCAKGVIDVLVGDKATAFGLGVVTAEVYVVEAMKN